MENKRSYIKCDICHKPILYKKDLFAGPMNRTHSIYIGALFGRNIRKYHNNCFRRLSALDKMNNNILPMSGVWGTIMILIFPIFCLVAVAITLSLKTSIVQIGAALLIMLAVILIFEIPLIRLRLKIKSEYEDILS